MFAGDSCTYTVYISLVPKTMYPPSKRDVSYNQQKDVFLVCIFVWIVLFGSWNLFISTFPYGLISVASLIILVYYIKLPFPDEQTVENVLGSELHIEDSGFKIRSVAHRGCGYDAPENSIQAFNLSKENGFPAIECDVMLTSDGVPVMFHDATMDRMANKSIDVGSSTWEDIKKVDISVTHPFKERFTNTNIPSLDQAITQILKNGQKVFIDLKKSDLKIVPVILDLYKRHPDLHKVGAVTSFYPHLIYLIRRKNPKIVGFCAWRPYIFSHESYSYTTGMGPRRYKQFYLHGLACFLNIVTEWMLTKITYYLVGLSAVLLHRDVISGELVMHFRNRGVRVICWSVNTPTEKQFWARHLKITYLTDTVTGENSTHQMLS